MMRMNKLLEKRRQERDIKRRLNNVKTLHEGKGVVYSLIASSEKNLENALKMAKRNKKMKPMVAGITAALEAIRRID